jgi:hypothetical protein
VPRHHVDRLLGRRAWSRSPGLQVLTPSVLVLVGRAMRSPTDLEPGFHQPRERASGLHDLQSATPGGPVTYPYRQNPTCGIFVGNPCSYALAPKSMRPENQRNIM